MEPIEFEHQTKVLSRPESMTEEECEPLPVWTDGQKCVSCWRPAWRERLSILLFGRVWLWIYSGETQPPAAIDGTKKIFKWKKEKLIDGND